MAGIALGAVPEKALEPRLRGFRARRPDLTQTAGPIGVMRLEAEAFEQVALDGLCGPQRLRRRQRRWRVAQRQHAAPERGEHTKAATVLVADVVRRNQEVAGKGFRIYTELCQRGFKLFGDGEMGLVRDLVPEHRSRAGLARDVGDNLGRRALPQHQGRSLGLEACLQRPQRLRQPPARRAAERAQARARFVQHKEADHRRTGFGGGVQGGMVGKPQVIAKPDDDRRRGGWVGHPGRQLESRPSGPS